jgi:hypothetical protein
MSQEHCLLGERKDDEENSVGMDWCIMMFVWIFNGKNEKK